jgi:hypothetical protein
MFAIFSGQYDFSNDADIGRVTIFSLIDLVLGLVFILCHAGLSKASASWMLAAGAFFAVGITIGFMFGLPKTPHPEVNTNLEQISDWLTKILVGVGLTQLTNIPPALALLAQFVAGGEGSSGPDRSLAFFIIFYFFFGGFVCGYLETRVYLTGAFFRAQNSRPEDELVESELVVPDPRPPSN